MRRELAWISRSPSRNRSPIRAAFSTSPSSRTTSSVARPAAHGTRRPAEREEAVRGHVEQLAPTDDRRERQPSAERLPERHRIGDDSGVLEGEHAPGPAEARLHLVEDEPDPVPIAQLPQRWDHVGGRNDLPAVGLDGLHQNRRGVLRGRDRAERVALEMLEASERAALAVARARKRTGTDRGTGPWSRSRRRSPTPGPGGPTAPAEPGRRPVIAADERDQAAPAGRHRQQPRDAVVGVRAGRPEPRLLREVTRNEPAEPLGRDRPRPSLAWQHSMPVCWRSSAATIAPATRGCP